MRRSKTWWLGVALCLLVVGNGCSSSGSSSPADGDRDQDATDETDIVESEDVVDEQTERADPAEESVADQAEESTADTPQEEAEIDPCVLPTGSPKCWQCGKTCQEATDCSPGYTCNQGECTRQCVPDTADRIYDDCGAGWQCHNQRYYNVYIGSVDQWLCARGSAAACASDQDCSVEGETCRGAWPAFRLDGFSLFCTTEVPCAAEFGSSCTTNSDCANGWCVWHPYTGIASCSRTCALDQHCPDGMQCRDSYLFNYLGTVGPDVFQAYCVAPNVGLAPTGKHTVCYQDSQCAQDGEACIGLTTALFAEPGPSYLRYCAPYSAGPALGQSCPAQGVCATQLCLDGVCSRPCRTVDRRGLGLADPVCPDTMTCVRKTFTPLGDSITMDACMPIAGSWTSCASDADCAGGEVCGGLRAEDGADHYSAHCIQPRGERAFGASCEKSTADPSTTCANGLCHMTDKRCTVVCDPDDETTCPDGYGCVAQHPASGSLPAYVCQLK